MFQKIHSDLLEKVANYNKDEGTQIALGEVNDALTALSLVIAIHKPSRLQNQTLCLGCGCEFVWPCPTIQGIRRELNDGLRKCN
jgi:hypothetical protein